MIYQNKTGKWYRKCPTCGVELTIKSNNKYVIKYYDKLKMECRSCCRKGKKCYNFGKKQSTKTKEKIGTSNLGKVRTKEHKKKYSDWQKGSKAFWYGKSMSDETKIKMSKARIGKKSSFITKEKLSKQKRGKKNPFYNKKFSKLHRKNLRVAALKRLKRDGIIISYNKKACEFIDDFGKKHGYNFQHAMNGGEVSISGYSLDGYDKENNIVFEYDEKHHRYIRNRKRDIIRQNDIIKEIRPTLFFRYNEWHNILLEVITKTNIKLR